MTASRSRSGIVALGMVLAVVVATAGSLVTREEERLLAEPTKGNDAPAGSADAPQSFLDPKDIVEVIAQDGIPSIDEPEFIDPEEAGWLRPQEPVVAVNIKGEARAYPLQILTWHEIVNDTVAETPIAVTFCPLCNTAVAYERPNIGGEVTTFGTSGKLINSNLLMYDRATESLWPQVTGVALTGSQEGRSLRRIPAQIVSWGDFSASNPEGLVLSRETGFDRRYGDNPYPGYDDIDKAPFLYSGEVDGRLAAVERVLGVAVKGDVLAFPYFRLTEEAEGGVSVAQADVGGTPALVMWRAGTTSALDETTIAASRDVGAAAAFERRLEGKTLDFIVRDGAVVDRQTETEWDIFGRAVSGPLIDKKLRPIPATDSFWFDWAAFHPETGLWKP